MSFLRSGRTLAWSTLPPSASRVKLVRADPRTWRLAMSRATTVRWRASHVGAEGEGFEPRGLGGPSGFQAGAGLVRLWLRMAG
jgi:hypothetical protein